MPWKTTNCALCAQNCGLEVQVEDNKIVKVRGDKNNPRSEGYVCRKGLNVSFHQHHADRLLYPLKRVGDQFERISWGHAVSEIAEKLKGILDEHGPRSLAYIVSGQGCHMAIPFVRKFGRFLQSIEQMTRFPACNGVNNVQPISSQVFFHEILFSLIFQNHSYLAH